MDKRGSGILLHISSLPSPHGVGDLGPRAYDFADFLAASGQRVWQILPLNPTDLAFDNSPYHCSTAFAFNPLLISPELLVEERLIDRRDLNPPKKFPREGVDFRNVRKFKRKIFHVAYENFKKKGKEEDFERFCIDNASWLDDYSLFTVLKSRFGAQSWREWPSEFRNREPGALKTIQKEHQDELRKEKFLQYVFDKQWKRLKGYCNQKGILIFGDLPIYVVYDSVDLWIHPELFKLDSHKKPYVVAGVPPDYFSKTGQLWGNPLYSWDVLQQTRYDWWIKRMEHNLRLFDWVRMDHFRGFVGYWEVSAKERTAIKGKWVTAPAMDFFSELKQRFRSLPIVAEDLGVITPDVREVMEHFDFPGMKILLFAFGEDHPDHPYLPHTYEKNCVVYTGTHDNNTVQGWFKNEAKPQDRKRLFRYLGKTVSEKDVHWEFIGLGMMSAANTFIVPMQDVLGLGEEARMNKPATRRGNWRWRLLSEQLTESLVKKLGERTETSGRT